MRNLFVLGVIVIVGCQSPPPEPGPEPSFAAASAGASWCAPSLCATCDLDPTFYEAGCPTMAAWCNEPKACPPGLEPLFCSGDPPYGSCVFVGVAVCDESNSTWCCTPNGVPIGSEWSCKVNADCPAATRACIVPACYSGACVLEVQPDNSPCSDMGGTHCFAGLCVP